LGELLLFTTAVALPGILLFWLMMRAGLIDASIGTAGVEGEGDARARTDDGADVNKPAAAPR
jgi:PAT family beta-lactamase induction signal transducer AmpG